MKIIWFCLSFLSLSLAVVGQPVQVSANDLLVEAALIEGAKESFLRNTDKAVAIYQKLLKDYPSNDLADYYLALIYQDSSQWEKAISYALSATKKSPDNRWFQQKLADLYLQNNQLIGEVSEVVKLPGQDLLSVDKNGHQVLIPMVKQIIISIDVAAKKIVVNPPEGLLDVAD